MKTFALLALLAGTTLAQAGEVSRLTSMSREPGASGVPEVGQE